jgi:hypothetical protein
MADQLRKLGFEVTEGHDLTKADMDRTIRSFAKTLGGSELALFFYAGHGLQFRGQNYLVPIDAKLTTAAALDFEMVQLDLVQRTMEREASTNIIILDACRDNPLARNLARALGTRSAAIGRGLAAVESGEGTLISFSTQPGNVALDGAGRNSPFAAALLKHIATPGDDLPTILINVRNDVMAATARHQVPWEHSALTAKVYFVPPQLTGSAADQQIELTFWGSVKDSTDPAVLGTYLERYPKGQFVPIARALIEHFERQAKIEQANREGDQTHRLEKPKGGAQVIAAPGTVAAAGVPSTIEKSPELPSGQFDGTWHVEWLNNNKCTTKIQSATWTVTKGELTTGVGRGTVTDGGQLRLTYPCRLHPDRTCRIQARLSGGRGAGTFAGADGCGGRVMLTRM